ncbi:hypothetical protein [Geodermatophilus marinus]|uniref:hypothetical protein n=1 Tax=Geodermatophilus sp. LHW52908 TaxID=2303986 RepID=UPI000E3DE7AC|nr:hypothetical protein [Geodermatophilus sp. LHW52908]RFU18828.1 hypothetical protein D0Z06_24565 [Geodermatophilus sp. LHW52908]
MIDQDTEAEVAAEIETYRRRLDSVRQDPQLSEEGRRNAIARLYSGVTSRIAGRRTALASSVGTERSKLEGDLFGAGYYLRDQVAAAVSLRDAEDRVDRVPAGDEDGLSRLLARALRNGDEILAKACLRRGWDEGSNRVVNEYADARPDKVPAIERLIDLRNTSAAGDAVTDLREMIFIVPKPQELAFYYSDQQIAAMAEGGDVPMPGGGEVYGSFPEAAYNGHPR